MTPPAAWDRWDNRPGTPPAMFDVAHDPRGSPKRSIGESMGDENVSHDEARTQDRGVDAIGLDVADWALKDDLVLRHENRMIEIKKLIEMGVFVPVLKAKRDFAAPLFNHTWVDKPEKSRIARCDYNDGLEQDGTFSPTPSCTTVRVLESKALLSNYGILRADICCAFPHAKEKEKVYMRPAKEWCEEFVDEDGTSGYDYVWLLVMSLYGRRTAGANWREHFEMVMKKFSPTLERDLRDPCLFHDRRLDLDLVHHVDDLAMTGPDEVLEEAIAFFA